MKRVRLTLKRSLSGTIPRHRRALKSLGLTRIGKSAVMPDNEATRGIMFHLKHLVEVEEEHAG